MAQTTLNSIPILVEQIDNPKAEICNCSQGFKIELRLR